MIKKDLYCKKCKNYPDNIVDEETVITRRTWDGECYQGHNTEYPGDDIRNYCAECDTELTEKIQK